MARATRGGRKLEDVGRHEFPRHSIPPQSRGVAVPPDVRPRPARRPSVPGDHSPVPGTAVRFPELVIRPITVILPTSQTYPILRAFSGVSRKKKASDPPIPIFFPDFLVLLR